MAESLTIFYNKEGTVIMKVGHLNVQPVSCASGVSGFFGEGYWFHKLLFPLICWIKLPWVTFVAKTTTWDKREGNTPLSDKDGITPQEWFPRSVVVKLWKNVVLNAWGLSGPGLQALYEKGLWQKRRHDFWLSFMSVAKTMDEQKEELRNAVRFLLAHLSEFGATVGLQLNVSCPNAGVCMLNIVRTTYELLDVVDQEDPEGHLTVEVKPPPTATARDIAEMAKHQRCTAFCLFNTLAFGMLAEEVDWENYFGTKKPEESPLISRLGKEKNQSGGLSGKPLHRILCRKIREARALGVTKHINACGGILGPISAWKAMRAGADSIALGTIITLRPHLVFPVIITAHVVHWFRKNSRKSNGTFYSR